AVDLGDRVVVGDLQHVAQHVGIGGGTAHAHLEAGHVEAAEAAGSLAQGRGRHGQASGGTRRNVPGCRRRASSMRFSSATGRHCPAWSTVMRLPGNSLLQRKARIGGACRFGSMRISWKILSVCVVTLTASSPMPCSVVSKNRSSVSFSALPRTNCCSGASIPGMVASPSCACLSSVYSPGLYRTSIGSGARWCQ